MIIEIIKFIIYSSLIVLISKYILVNSLRKLAENLKLKSNVIGNIAGYATSIPELLTVSISSFTGLIDASIFNILSSNIINFIQYIFSIIINKNIKETKNKAIKVDIILVIITIIIPIILLNLETDMNLYLVPLFILLAIIFITINNIYHKKYLKNVEDELLLNEQNKEKEEIKSNKKTYIYILLLIISGILLYFVGNKLGETLENMSKYFNISEIIIGILLGFITSIPELITFFESQRHYKKSETNQILGVVEATNNLFTSNILNLFIIQTIGIIICNIFITCKCQEFL